MARTVEERVVELPSLQRIIAGLARFDNDQAGGFWRGVWSRWLESDHQRFAIPGLPRNLRYDRTVIGGDSGSSHIQVWFRSPVEDVFVFQIRPVAAGLVELKLVDMNDAWRNSAVESVLDQLWTYGDASTIHAMSALSEVA